MERCSPVSKSGTAAGTLPASGGGSHLAVTGRVRLPRSDFDRTGRNRGRVGYLVACSTPVLLPHGDDCRGLRMHQVRLHECDVSRDYSPARSSSRSTRPPAPRAPDCYAPAWRSGSDPHQTAGLLTSETITRLHATRRHQSSAQCSAVPAATTNDHSGTPRAARSGRSGRPRPLTSRRAERRSDHRARRVAGRSLL